MRLEIHEFQHLYRRIRSEVGKVMVGHEELVELVLVALFAGGHVLLEGVPGVGKTLLVKTVARVLNLRFSRIQFTPDLMPADIVGTNVLVTDEDGRRHFTFQPGPVFSQLVLADEINRATPKTQSALLEAMQELAVTVSGVSYPLERPFFVLATQNPIEMEGTYPLPEAQLDRFFFKLRVPYPDVDSLVEILDRTTGAVLSEAEPVADGATVLAMQALVREVAVAPHLLGYVARLVEATHPTSPRCSALVSRFVRYGSSPRGAQAILLGAKVRALAAGRAHVSAEDIRSVVLPALRHRILLNFEGEAEGVDPDRILRDVLAHTPELEPAESLPTP
ncbi:MAG: MoxR family ATPase [Armatimonadota bacterium]|nr:MoxR family ATPase [Armatimonadota bacterium]MDR7443793.1 MoxR family ATPase [Armatimonadota bacterium]MDR7569038.1 MoxR family ATPase [Armatimonadota bacterium]MDR7613927.1 MoxR family ATPase [Armatimonadota bacterium]